MSLVSAAPLFTARNSRSGYQIEQSLRFNSADSAYLNRTPASAGNRKTYTLSAWVKICVFGNSLRIFEAGTSNSTDRTLLYFSSNKFQFFTETGNVVKGELSTNAVFRDPSAWYHVVWAVDTANTSVKIYVNGVEQTLTTTTAVANENTYVNATNVHYISQALTTTSGYLDGYLAEVNFIDGSALDPTDFGEFDNNGVWRPIEYEGGNYGTTGFYLKFDPSATNGIGHDHSGNGNNFTASGFTTSGTGTDVMSDTPTANYATINPLETFNGRFSNAPTNGNLEISIPSDVTLLRNYAGMHASIVVPTTGKYYFEFEASQQYTRFVAVDVEYSYSVSTGDDYALTNKKSVIFSVFDGNYYYDGGANSTASGHGGNSAPSGDIYGVAIDLGNGTLQVDLNGTAGTELDISDWAGGSARVAAFVDSSGSSGTIKYNFGQREFAYPPGTSSATGYFNTVTYTGNGSTQSITGVGFQPDLVWIKTRSIGSNHSWYDVLRGTDKVIGSSATDAEITDGSVTPTATGFTLGSENTTFGSTNFSGATYVAWCWKAGGTASSNTDGDIDSSVSASTDAGFSVFTYTGNGGTDQTVGHGLGVTPSFCIVKSRGSNSWYIRHNSLGSNKNLNFNSSGAVVPGGGGLIGDLSSISTITLKSGSTNADNINANGTNYIAYCWADKDGVTKTGTYTGNGSDPGNISVDCGFKPAMVMVKGDATASWQIIDNERGEDTALFPDSSAAENSRSDRKILLTQSGFIVQGNDGNINSSGVNYYFIAFAENFSAGTDFKSLNTANLPAPDIADGSEYFNTVLYTGNSSTQSITGVGFQPDFVWAKSRVETYSHYLFDVVRGAGVYIISNNANAEVSDTSTLSSFDTDGFSLGNAPGTNSNTKNYVAWNWLAGGSVSADNNTAGSITSTVSANPSAGFSIVGYTGTFSADTIGHGLGVAPSMIITKIRDVGDRWQVYHSSLGNGQVLRLELDVAAAADSAAWNSTSPTSAVFSVGGSVRTNRSGSDFIAYCFAEVEGYSKFGSYEGNNSADGPFVALSFAPAFLLVKAADSTGDWQIVDNKRDVDNPTEDVLQPSLSSAEVTATSSAYLHCDLLSNGFKIRGNSSRINVSNTYIYAAFAENPFGGDGVSPATAR
jgi:hypothetical protein